MNKDGTEMTIRLARQLPLLGEEPLGIPPDGRQSERALAIRRGVCRRLRAEGLALIPEVTLRSGRRADLVALGDDGMITIVEIKSSIEDFRADAKWQDYCFHADHFYFATGPDVPAEIFPLEAGLIVADPYGAEILRASTCTPISGGAPQGNADPHRPRRRVSPAQPGRSGFRKRDDVTAAPVSLAGCFSSPLMSQQARTSYRLAGWGKEKS